jgi:hypothetical protein
MMFRHLLLVALLGSATNVMAESCTRPTAKVDVPDGQTASEAAMVAASEDVRQFVGNGQTYVDCLQEQMDAAKLVVDKANTPGNEVAHEAANKEYLALIQKHDSMVGEMKAKASDFNDALRAYKTRAD